MTPSASTTARPPRLVLRFAVYSAIALALAWVAIFWVVRREAEDRAQHQVQDRTSEVAVRIAPSLTPEDFAGPVTTERRRQLDAAIDPELVGTLLRFKLVNADGVVTYSTDPEIIGGRSDSRASIESALAGEPDQHVTTLNAEGGNGENIKAVESYVPVYLGESSDPAGRLRGLRRLRTGRRRRARDRDPDRDRAGPRTRSALRRALPHPPAGHPCARQPAQAARGARIRAHTGARRAAARRGPPDSGGAQLPQPGRAAAARHVHHPPGRDELVHLHEPADRGADRLHGARVHERPVLPREDAPPGRPRAHAGGAAARGRDGRVVRDQVPHRRQGQAGGLDPRRGHDRQGRVGPPDPRAGLPGRRHAPGDRTTPARGAPRRAGSPPRDGARAHRRARRSEAPRADRATGGRAHRDGQQLCLSPRRRRAPSRRRHRRLRRQRRPSPHEGRGPRRPCLGER